MPSAAAPARSPAPPLRTAPPKPVALKKPAPIEAEDAETTARNKRLIMISVSLMLISALGYYFFFAAPAGPRERTAYPTEGLVRYQGKPAAGARVTLLPEKPAKDVYSPWGEAGADGSFKLTTYRTGDGAPAGRYKVGIVWMTPPEPASAGKQTDLQRLVTGEVKEPVDRLQERYSDPLTSGLSVEIKAEAPNKLDPFDLP
jgi:hypothetical protein